MRENGQGDVNVAGHNPLPKGFYNSEQWHDAMLDHYADNVLPKDVIEFPIRALAAGMEDIINVYGNFPDELVKLIKQAVNPKISLHEYRENIYKIIKQEAINNKNPYIDKIAEGLYYIRLLFERDANYLKEYFADEISHVDGSWEEEKINKLADELSKIARVHIRQVAGVIERYCHG